MSRLYTRIGFFFKFASEYVPQKGLSVPISITTKIMNDFIKYAKNFNTEYLLPGEKELSDLKNQLIVEYLDESIDNDYRTKNVDGNSVIIDAQRWMKIRNRAGKTIKVKPPSSHDKNSGEYFFNELNELIPLTGLSQESASELNYLTKDIENYFNDIKQSQYNNAKNLKWIENALLREMSLVAKDEREKVKVSLYNDKEYLEAVNILLDTEKYLELLTP